MNFVKHMMKTYKDIADTEGHINLAPEGFEQLHDIVLKGLKNEFAKGIMVGAVGPLLVVAGYRGIKTIQDKWTKKVEDEIRED